MALNITEDLRQELKNTKLTPILVLKIEGYERVFNNTLVKTYIKIGDPGLKIGEPLPPELAVWKIGGFKTVAEQSPFVNFNIGTTTKLTQKLDPSRGLGSSVSQMNIVLVDKNEEITNFISPGKILAEVLGRRVTIELGLEGSSYPQDYNVIFRGNIQDVESAAGSITLSLNNTEERKRRTIFPPASTVLVERLFYRSAFFGDLFYENQPGITDTITIDLIAGGTVGAEVVTIIGNTVRVQIADNVTTATQLKKALESSIAAMQLISVTLDGNKDTLQIVNNFPLFIALFVEAESAAGFLDYEDGGTLRPYLKIGEEMIEYNNVAFTGTSFEAPMVRGAFNSSAASAEVGEDVEAFVRLQGNAIDLILKLLISTSAEFFVSGMEVESVGIFLGDSIPNALFFESVDVEELYGVSPGDFITTIDSVIPSNNVTGSIVLGVGKVTNGSYIIISDTLTDEANTAMKVSIKSQFNTLSIGVGLLPNEVDIKQHVFIRDTFLPGVVLDLMTNEIPNGKEFIETQLYLPISCFSVPRKGRSSIVYQVPPLATQDIVTLGKNNVVDPDKLRIRRSIAENFFNQINYTFDFDPVSNAMKSNLTYNSLDSQARIPVGFKAFSINSKALRSENGAVNLTAQNANRLLRRYQYGAEYIKGMKVLYGPGYQIEIGDPVIVNFTELKLSDSRSGTREGDLRIMEVLNKTMDIKTGDITLDLVDTAFGVNDRLGLVSPSTLTGVGSTTSKLIIQKSFGTKSFDRESSKWTNGGYIGQEITVRNEDFTQSYDTILRGFDNNNPQGMLIDTIPVAPGENWTIQNPRYPDSTDLDDLAFWKLRHAYFSPQVPVTNAVTLGQDKFKASAPNMLKFFVGSVCKVHNYEYSDDGIEQSVIDVDLGGNIITLSGSVGFDINDTHLVDLIGFPDKGGAYRII